jgi:hypothetical protein
MLNASTLQGKVGPGVQLLHCNCSGAMLQLLHHDSTLQGLTAVFNCARWLETSNVHALPVHRASCKALLLRT